MAARFGRVITAMVTPFDADLRVDERQVVRLCDYLLSHGSDSLVVCGTTGESATLAHEEKLALFRQVKSIAGGQACVIAGTGTNNTADTIALTREAEEIGVDAALVVAPYYNRPSQEGLYQHFCAVAKATKLPILLYNVPPRTSVNIGAPTVARIAADCGNVVAIKEASNDLAQIGEIRATTPDSFEIYSGADEANLPILALGGVGAVSVTSHVAGTDLARMHDAFFCADTDTARRIHLKTLPLTKALFVVSSPAPVKWALKRLGAIESAALRLPLVGPNEQEQAVIESALRTYGLV